MHMAVERKDVEMCQFLLHQKHVEVDEMSYAGVTAYQAACQGWDKTLAETLLSHGADTYLPSDCEDEGDSDEEV